MCSPKSIYPIHPLPRAPTPDYFWFQSFILFCFFNGLTLVLLILLNNTMMVTQRNLHLLWKWFRPRVSLLPSLFTVTTEQCSWQAAGRGQGRPCTSYNTQDSPTEKNDPAPVSQHRCRGALLWSTECEVLVVSMTDDGMRDESNYKMIHLRNEGSSNSKSINKFI